MKLKKPTKKRKVYGRRLYAIEILRENGEWGDAGDVYENEEKKYTRAEMVAVNFMGHKIRMVERCVTNMQVGFALDFRGRTIKRTNR